MRMCLAGLALLAALARADVSAVRPASPVSDQSVSVHDFLGDGAIVSGVADTAELQFNGLFLIVDAFDGDGIEVEVAIADPDDVFAPLKRFASGESIGPNRAYAKRGDVIFEFRQGVDGLMGFRFRTEGDPAYRYGWVSFHWETRVVAGRQLEFMTVNEAAWSATSGASIRAGAAEGGPRLVRTQWAAGAASVSLESRAGLSYVLQKKRRFVDPAWIDAVTVQGTGETIVLRDQDAQADVGFYRVKVD